MTDNMPKTKKECFAQLDEMLSEEEKRDIVKMDMVELHFSLGLWVRNNWLYPRTDEELDVLLREFGEEPMFCHPDDFSTIILKAYRKHLKRKMSKNQK